MFYLFNWKGGGGMARLARLEISTLESWLAPCPPINLSLLINKHIPHPITVCITLPHRLV